MTMKKNSKQSEKLTPEEKAVKMKKLVSNNMSHIKYKYLVLSGKGGVGTVPDAGIGPLLSSTGHKKTSESA